ncbi:MAG TPA: UDP-glucose 4-epimerase GalE [Bacteroidales bacterium]|nr:UDP-glucose 4-epimerase GalE [Bacteroidales bacterium]
MDDNSKILVTGGTGYIGSHTVVELQQAGFDVIVADNLSNSSANVIDLITQITGKKPAFEKIDLCDNLACDYLFHKYNITAVIHFAAFKAVGESVKEPLKYYKNNLFSLINLLESMKKNNISKIIFSSSCTVYGNPDKLPVNETMPVKPALSPYGNTKQIAEEILYDEVNTQKKFNVISLRYFNPIGAHHTIIIGEDCKDEPNNLIPYITQTAIGKRPFLRVFGNDYDTPDGTPIRDYIHVSDVALAHVSALQRLVNNKNEKNFEIFNLGTGKGYSVLQIIKTFEKISGIKLPYKIVERRPGDVPAVWADTSLANKVLGWKASKDLDEMITSAWKWELKKANKL